MAWIIRLSKICCIIQSVILWFLLGILAHRFHDEDHANLLNSMWLTAITFLCVGYGDIVPNTYCGRGITLTCGMVVCIITNGRLIGYFLNESSSTYRFDVRWSLHLGIARRYFWMSLVLYILLTCSV